MESDNGPFRLFYLGHSSLHIISDFYSSFLQTALGLLLVIGRVR